MLLDRIGNLWRIQAALLNCRSCVSPPQAGSDFMLPLANPESLALLGISLPELTQLCTAATQFIGFVVDKTQERGPLGLLGSR